MLSINNIYWTQNFKKLINLSEQFILPKGINRFGKTLVVIEQEGQGIKISRGDINDLHHFVSVVFSRSVTAAAIINGIIVVTGKENGVDFSGHCDLIAETKVFSYNQATKGKFSGLYFLGDAIISNVIKPGATKLAITTDGRT